MVNTGKPSRGCYMCRARRIKCDEGKPSCMRCQKSKRICPGYRNPFELKLRDETKSMKQKQTSGNGNKRNRTIFSLLSDVDDHNYRSCDRYWDDAQAHTTPHASSWSQSDWIEYDNFPWDGESASPSKDVTDTSVPDLRTTMLSRGWCRNQPSIIQQALGTPVDQQAICFFLANYVLIPGLDSIPGRGHLDFLVPMLQSAPADSPLSVTFTSVGLATMAGRPNSRALMPMASSTYIKALRRINFALKDPRTAMSDATLATILLLSVFEQITSSDLEVTGWASHIHGAVALIKARGSRGVRTKTAREMFISVRELMTIHYMAKSIPIDPNVDWWTKTVFNGKDDVMEAYARFNLLVAELRQDTDKATSLAPQTPANIEAVVALLHRAQNLEREYREWYTMLPLRWKHSVLKWMDWDSLGLPMGANLSKSIIHPGRVDTYSELSVAFAHNVARSSQILVWTTILRCIAWLSPDADYRATPEYRRATQICTSLINDIVASVPYFFGWNAETDPRAAVSVNDGDGIKGVSGVFLMWPLFAAASSDFCSDSQRVFLRGRLEFINENMGISQAKVLLNVPWRFPSVQIIRERMNLKMNPIQRPNPSSSNETSAISDPTIPEVTTKDSSSLSIRK